MKNKPVDLRFLEECFDVDYEKGILYWKTERPSHHFKKEPDRVCWTTKYAGKIAGGIVNTNTHAYLAVKISRNAKAILYKVHRIIYSLYHSDGCAPDVDHFDGDTLNNSISNLRPCAGFSNARNSKKRSDNTSGITGVTYNVGKGGVWEISIGIGSGSVRGASRRDFFEACCIRKAWELDLEYPQRHGI